MDAYAMMQECLFSAANHWETWENSGQENIYHRGKAEQYEARAAQFAAIIQAEQLKRIADTLEAIAKPAETSQTRAAMDAIRYPLFDGPHALDDIPL